MSIKSWWYQITGKSQAEIYDLTKQDQYDALNKEKDRYTSLSDTKAEYEKRIADEKTRSAEEIKAYETDYTGYADDIEANGEEKAKGLEARGDQEARQIREEAEARIKEMQASYEEEIKLEQSNVDVRTQQSEHYTQQADASQAKLDNYENSDASKLPVTEVNVDTWRSEIQGDRDQAEQYQQQAAEAQQRKEELERQMKEQEKQIREAAEAQAKAVEEKWDGKANEERVKAKEKAENIRSEGKETVEAMKADSESTINSYNESIAKIDSEMDSLSAKIDEHETAIARVYENTTEDVKAPEYDSAVCGNPETEVNAYKEQVQTSNMGMSEDKTTQETKTSIPSTKTLDKAEESKQATQQTTTKGAAQQAKTLPESGTKTQEDQAAAEAEGIANLAKEINAGRWGDGAARAEALKDNPYYAGAQELINQQYAESKLFTAAWSQASAEATETHDDTSLRGEQVKDRGKTVDQDLANEGVTVVLEGDSIQGYSVAPGYGG